MKKMFFGLAVAWFLYAQGTGLCAEKFQTSSTSDLLTQSSTQDLKNQDFFKTPAIPAPPPLEPTSPPIVPAPAQTQQPVLSAPLAPPLTTQDLKTHSIPRSTLDLKGTKITTTDYEAKFYEQIQRELEAKMPKKKKKLMEVIREELANYGIIILLGLVAFIAIYVSRKEPERITTPHPQTPFTEEEPKKDIWHDDFQ